MIKTVRRLSLGAVTLMAAAVLTAGPALAGHCTNADKNAAAGVQIVIAIPSGQIVWISNGLQARIDQGLVDLATGEGFHGLIGFDVTGDGVADLTTFIVTPNFAIPEQAQLNGAACHGIVSIEVFFTQCLT
jgi:hypothetical protein